MVGLDINKLNKKTNSVSVKKFIANYVILKILKLHYLELEKIPSENSFAEKFNCSRLTARSALLLLSHTGILIPIRGSGYVLSNQALKILFPPKYIQVNSDHFKTKVLATNKNTIELITNYYDKNDNIIGIVKWEVDKQIYISISKKYEIVDNICDYIIDSNLELISFKEYIDYDIKKNELWICREHFTKDKKKLISTKSWFKDIKKLTCRKTEFF